MLRAEDSKNDVPFDLHIETSSVPRLKVRVLLQLTRST